MTASIASRVVGAVVAGSLVLAPLSSASAAPPNTNCPFGFVKQPITDNTAT